MLAKTFGQAAKYLGLYLFLCVATLLMLTTVVKHFSFDPNVGFLAFKQEYIHITTWRVAFYVHVFTSVLTLMAGFTQFSPDILHHNKNIHRAIGKMYVILILLINFPSAMIMAVYANGLLPARIAFVILDCLWFWFTLKAFLEIKKGNVAAHKRFMIRSYALTLSAISLRTWKLILSNTTDFDPLTLYMIDAWLGFVPNLLLAEIIIQLKFKKTLPLKRYTEVNNQ